MACPKCFPDASEPIALCALHSLPAAKGKSTPDPDELADLFRPEKVFSDAPGDYKDPALRETAKRMLDAWNGRFPDPDEVRRALEKSSDRRSGWDQDVIDEAAEEYLREHGAPTR